MDPEVLVLGSGPNGLVAACQLAQAGLRVLVLEADPRRHGGAVGSVESTLPGFVHDVGAAFFTFAHASPALRELDLPSHGLVWRNATFESCHPAPDGSVACIARDVERTAAHFGTPADGRRWARLARWHATVEERLLAALLGPIPTLGPAVALGPLNLLRLGGIFAASAAGFARRSFESEAARRVLPSLGLHVDVAPGDPFGAAVGYVLGLVASTGGYSVPEGGAQRVADALLAALHARGGDLRLGTRVAEIVVRDGRARAVRTADGLEIEAPAAILADTSAPALFLDLLPEAHVPRGLRRRMSRFPSGWGTFKLDWALSGPVPWKAPEARQSAVVHTGDSLADLERFAREVRAGKLPQHPYLVLGQQSLVDPSRAPAGQHTLWGYSRVPARPSGGWSQQREAFAERVEARIEALAPGFRDRILARQVHAPPDLERANPNLRDGDLGGGTAAWQRQFLLRPAFPYFRYRTPVKGLYLCSSYAHPGAGVHGMCGRNAARMALADLGARGEGPVLGSA